MRTHYVNAEFDLSLRSRRARGGESALRRQIEELTLQGLLGAEAGDRALLRCDVPDEFPEHLVSCGFTVPEPLRHPDIDEATRLRPYGWTHEAIELNRRHDRPVPHPDLAVIRRVNARSFGVDLERDLGIAAASSRTIASLAELESFLDGAPAGSRCVVKAEHANSGLGNLRLTGTPLTDPERRFVARRLDEDDRIVVERWLSRHRDWCTIFDVPRSTGARTYESICTDGGALIGALFEPGGSATPETAKQLQACAERIAARLGSEGYFGPVCLDSFTWLDGEVERLRPLVDLNCRRSLSDRAHALWKLHLSDRTLYYRFFNRRKLALAARLDGVLDALGRRRYDPERRSGILIASPLRIIREGQRRAPTKLAVGFVADDRAGVFALERWFRTTFER